MASTSSGSAASSLSLSPFRTSNPTPLSTSPISSPRMAAKDVIRPGLRCRRGAPSPRRGDTMTWVIGAWAPLPPPLTLSLSPYPWRTSMGCATGKGGHPYQPGPNIPVVHHLLRCATSKLLPVTHFFVVCHGYIPMMHHCCNAPRVCNPPMVVS